MNIIQQVSIKSHLIVNNIKVPERQYSCCFSDDRLNTTVLRHKSLTKNNLFICFLLDKVGSDHESSIVFTRKFNYTILVELN